MSILLPRLRRIPPLSAVLLLFGITIIIVNPLRETALMDDWAYALTVKGLIETGRYALHQWLAANMPFQAAWGALFSLIFGYSHIALRLSTLVLAVIGLVSFYQLAREHDLSASHAALLALILLSSPLMLRLSFTFMTDVPFVSLCLLAMWLYTRAMRQNDLWVMLAASLAAGAAILTRQFGAAFVAMLGILWLIDSHKWRRIPFYVAGALIPLIAVAWQLYAGSVTANWTAEALTNDQAAYLRSGIVVFDVFWRSVVIFEYMALFALPLVLALIVRFVQDARQYDDMSDPQARRALALIGVPAVIMLAIRLIGTLVFERRGTLPLILWNLDVIDTWPAVLSSALTALCLIGGVLIVRAVMLRYASPRPLHQWVLDAATVFFFTLQLIFVQFGDEYLLPLLPYTLIVLGHAVLPDASVWLKRGLVGASLAVLLISAQWTREMITTSAAMWQASEELAAQGIPTQQVASMWEWEAYHGSFDRYLARLPEGEIGRLGDYLNEYFQVFRESERLHACYLISLNPPSDPAWRNIDELTYQRCEETES